MRSRRLVPALVVLCGVALAGCGSDGAAPAPTGSTPVTASATPSAAVTSAADLGRLVRSGVEPLQSARIDVDGGGVATLDGDGAVTLDDGRVTALDLSGPAAGGDGAVRVRVVDGTVARRTEDLRGAATGRWEPVTGTELAAVAAVVGGCDLGPLADAFARATGFAEIGTVGDGVVRYQLSDLSDGALPGALAGEVRLTRAAVDVDPAGRPRQVDAQLTVDGAAGTVRVRWSGFDQPVEIAAPTD